MDQFTRRIIGFGVCPRVPSRAETLADWDAVTRLRRFTSMFNRAQVFRPWVKTSGYLSAGWLGGGMLMIFPNACARFPRTRSRLLITSASEFPHAQNAIMSW